MTKTFRLANKHQEDGIFVQRRYWLYWNTLKVEHCEGVGYGPYGDCWDEDRVFDTWTEAITWLNNKYGIERYNLLPSVTLYGYMTKY